MKRFLPRIGPILLMALILGATGGCSKQTRVNRLLKAANAHFDAEKYDDAEVEYKSVLRQGGLNPTAIGQLGRLYARNGRMLEARVYLQKAAELQPNSLPFQLALGQVEVSHHDSTNAARIARRILSAQPTNEEALILLVDSSLDPRQLRQDLASLPRLAENPCYHLGLGVLAMRQKNLQEADKELGLAVAANPKSSLTYVALAELRGLEKRGKEANQAFETAVELAPQRSYIRSRYADHLVQHGSVEQARKLLQEMTGKAPDYIPGWISLMNLALAEKKYDEAARCADRVLERDERNFEALMGRGGACLAEGDAAKAAAVFEHMDAMYKKVPEVKYDLALAYFMGQDRVKGMAQLDKALALDPGHAKSALLMAEVEIRSGDPQAAITVLTRLIKKNPNVVQGHFMLADAYLARQRPEAALAVYRNLAAALPKNPQIPLFMGVVLALQHKNAEARAAFEKALELAPDYMAAAEQLINLDLAEHKYPEATAVAREEILKAPKAGEPWELLAKTDFAQANAAGAEADLLKAIELNPALPKPYLSLAEVYGATGKYEEALQKLNALAARTNDASVFVKIGAIRSRMNQFDAARQAYQKALAINSNSIPALNNLAYMDSVRLNRIDEAYEAAQKARLLAPYDPGVGDTLGWILFKKGDLAHALTLLEESAQKAPANAEIQFHLGMAHYLLDDEDAARVALQRAVAAPQDFPNKDEAGARLAILNTDISGTSASALAGLEKNLRDYPDDPVILSRIGVLQEHQSAFDKAAASYETALKKNPQAVSIMAKLARLYAWRLNQPDKALSLATAAHKLAPANAEVSGILGHLVYRAGDYGWALSLLESAADRFPDQPDLLYDLGWACYAVGRIADAQSAMQKALQNGAFAESEDAKRFVALTDAFGSPAKVQAVAGQARKILEAEAKYVPALMITGAADERAGEYKAARECYSQALAVFPQFAPAARQWAILDARHFSDDASGYTRAEQARNAYPDDPEVARSLGILSYYQARYSRSAELLREIAAQYKNDGELCYCLGMDDYQLKRPKESKQALERALALKIPETEAAEAKRILAALK
jgi:tetratricopeptide (TPR) repeat protein